MQTSASIDIQQLLLVLREGEKAEGPKITILFSLPHVSDFAIIGQAELKALTQEAEHRLKDFRIDERQRAAILRELEVIVNDPSIWKYRSNSYAIFITSKFAQVHALPIDLPRGVWISSRFHIAPLVPLLSLPDHFLVLEVSLGTPHLIRLHSTFATEIELDELEQFVLSRSDAEPITNRAFHTSRLSKNTSDRGIVVPHGSHQDEIWREEQRYLDVLAQTIDRKLRNEHAYLVISGTKDLASRLEKLLTYKPTLLSHKHLGLIRGESVETLWQGCIDLLVECKRSDEHQALEEYEEHKVKGAVVTSVRDIVDLAREGGIENLLIEHNVERALKNEYVEFVDAALSSTLLHHGKVLEVEKLPNNSECGVTAIVRPGWRETALALHRQR